MAKLPRAPRATVTVPQEIIDKAIHADSGRCMIAQAIEATVPNAVNAKVDMTSIRWTDSKKHVRYHYITPEKIREVLVRWDLGVPTEPFSFQLRAGVTTRSRPSVSRPRTEAEKALRRESDRSMATRKGDGSNPIPQGGKLPPLGALAAGARGSRRRVLGARHLIEQIEDAQRLAAEAREL